MHELWKEPMQRSMNSMKSINSHSMKLMELMIELKKARRNEGNEIKSFQFTPNGEMKLIDLHAVMKITSDEINSLSSFTEGMKQWMIEVTKCNAMG